MQNLAKVLSKSWIMALFLLHRQFELVAFYVSGRAFSLVLFGSTGEAADFSLVDTL